MRVNLKLALAALLSAALGIPAISYGQQYYDVSHTHGGGSDCNCQSACPCEDEEEEDDGVCEPWRLFPEVGGWQLYGFLNASVTANADGPASHFNGPVSFLDREGGRLNQAYFTLEKLADNGGCGVAFGGRIDAMFGTDYAFTQAAGLELHQDGTPHWNGTDWPGPVSPSREYGLALPQIYGEMAYNDLSIKVGHFYSIVGYQVVPAIGNFFITQPYTFQYGEPFTHTGAIASWKYTDELTLYLAGVNGWDKVDPITDRPAVLGGFNYAPDHGQYNIFNTTIIGEEDGVAVGPPNLLGTRFLNSLVFTYNISENLQYVFQNDYGTQQNGGANPGQDAEWYGVNQYLFYTVNECWKLGARAEWFRDDDGYRLISAPARLGGLTGPVLGPLGIGQAAVAGHYYEMALGANWKPSSNLTIRPEMRWDWSSGTGIAPYDDLTKDSQFIAAVDAILQF